MKGWRFAKNGETKARTAAVAPVAEISQPNGAQSTEARGNREPLAKFQPRSVRVHKRNNNR